jgi:hypothetical protein
VTPDDPNLTVLTADEGEWTQTTPTDTVSGLDHLEGMTVAALADGGVVGNLTVTSGSITLPAPASQIVVGLPFIAQLQTLYMESPGGPTVQSRRKDATQVVIRVESSSAPEIGCNQPDQSVQPNGATIPWGLSANKMTQIEDRTPDMPAGTPPPLYSGDFPITNVFATQDVRGQVAIQQTDPVPLTVLAVIPWWHIADTPG